MSALAERLQECADHLASLAQAPRVLHAADVAAIERRVAEARRALAEVTS